MIISLTFTVFGKWFLSTFHSLYTSIYLAVCFLYKSNTAIIQQPPDHVVLQDVLGPLHQVHRLVSVSSRLIPHLMMIMMRRIFLMLMKFPSAASLTSIPSLLSSTLTKTAWLRLGPGRAGTDFSVKRCKRFNTQSLHQLLTNLGPNFHRVNFSGQGSWAENCSSP